MSARFAILNDPQTIRGNVSVDKIAAHMDGAPTFGTVAKILRGDPGVYRYVHRVFTAVNIEKANNFNRVDHVFLHDKKDGSIAEENLSGFRTFPRFKYFCKFFGKTDQDIAREAGVDVGLVSDAREFFPIPEQPCIQLLNYVREYPSLSHLSPSSEINW